MKRLLAHTLRYLAQRLDPLEPMDSLTLYTDDTYGPSQSTRPVFLRRL